MPKRKITSSPSNHSQKGKRFRLNSKSSITDQENYRSKLRPRDNNRKIIANRKMSYYKVTCIEPRIMTMEHSVTIIPGIDNAAETMLSEKGINRAYTLLGKFVSVGRDPVIFQTWLNHMTGLGVRDTRLCCDSLAKYYMDNFSK